MISPGSPVLPEQAARGAYLDILRRMAAGKPKIEPTQTTEKGLEIPIPTREDFLRNLEKVAPPVESPELDKKRND
jgi:hypothetical protein